MTKYLVATHGELARGFVDTLQMIVGSDAEIGFFCMPKSKSGDDVEFEIRELLSDCGEHEYVVFADLFGGSVSNVFTTLLMEGKKFHLVAGVNLPLLIAVLLSAEEDPRKAIEEAIAEARQGIVYVNERIGGGGA